MMNVDNQRRIDLQIELYSAYMYINYLFLYPPYRTQINHTMSTGLTTPAREGRHHARSYTPPAHSINQDLSERLEKCGQYSI